LTAKKTSYKDYFKSHLKSGLENGHLRRKKYGKKKHDKDVLKTTLRCLCAGWVRNKKQCANNMLKEIGGPFPVDFIIVYL